MVYLVESGNGDIIERMWRLVVSARRNCDEPTLWRLTDDIVGAVQDFYRLGASVEENAASVLPSASALSLSRFLDIPVDPTTTMPHLLCRPNVVYHL